MSTFERIEMTAIFVAEFESTNTTSHGYGINAEEAVVALVFRWRDDYAPHSGASPDYLEEYRDDIKVFEVELGKGYVMGVSDVHARKPCAIGSDSRFDDAFSQPLAQGL
jgi:hypothetical protein